MNCIRDPTIEDNRCGPWNQSASIVSCLQKVDDGDGLLFDLVVVGRDSWWKNTGVDLSFNLVDGTINHQFGVLGVGISDFHEVNVLSEYQHIHDSEPEVGNEIVQRQWEAHKEGKKDVYLTIGGKNERLLVVPCNESVNDTRRLIFGCGWHGWKYW